MTEHLLKMRSDVDALALEIYQHLSKYGWAHDRSGDLRDVTVDGRYNLIALSALCQVVIAEQIQSQMESE